MYVYGPCLFYVCCSDCVGVWEKVGCVAAVVEDNVFSRFGMLKYVVCLCKRCVMDVVFYVCIVRY